MEEAMTADDEKTDREPFEGMTAEEVDAQLHKMMVNIHKVSAEAAEEYGLGYDLVAGANIAGFKKVAEAMYQQGMF